jgi:hypothetical protein
MSYWTCYEHACKDSRFNFVSIVLIKCFKIWFMKIVYKAIKHKKIFGQAYCIYLLKRISKKLLCIFLMLLWFYKFKWISWNLNRKMKYGKKENRWIVLGQFWPTASWTRLGPATKMVQVGPRQWRGARAHGAVIAPRPAHASDAATGGRHRD